MAIGAGQTFGDTGTTVTYKDLRVTSKNFRISAIDASQTFKQKYLSQRWQFELSSPPVLRSEAFEIMGLLRNNRTTTFILPTVSNTSGTASGTITAQLSSSASPEFNYTKGSTTVAVTGGSGTIKKGDFIKFSDHAKVYQVTSDVNLDGSSVDTISIFPGLFQDLTTGTTVVYNNVSFTVSHIGQELEIDTDENGYYEYTLNLQEDV
jgi:hypothetical protein